MIEAFATNGKEFQIAKLAESRFLYGPATPELLDKLLPFAPLHMTSAGWVELLFGQVYIPKDAVLTYSEESAQYRFEFERSETEVVVLVDPKTTKIQEIRGALAGATQYKVRIVQWAAEGIPGKLHIVVPSQELEVRMHIREIAMGQLLEDGLFVLDPIAGVASEYLGY